MQDTRKFSVPFYQKNDACLLSSFSNIHVQTDFPFAGIHPTGENYVFCPPLMVKNVDL